MSLPNTTLSHRFTSLFTPYALSYIHRQSIHPMLPNIP